MKSPEHSPATFRADYRQGKAPLPFPPEPFRPEIWTPEGHPEASPVLVCGRRAMRGPAVTGATPKRWQYVVHGVAIAIPPQGLPILLHRAETRDPAIVWKCQGVITATPGKEPPAHVGMLEIHGGFISKAAAQAALAQAWKCVDCCRDMATMEPRVFIREGRATAYRKDSATYRNIVACLSWTGWNRSKLSLDERAAMLRSLGFECTRKALQRMAEDCGLSLS